MKTITLILILALFIGCNRDGVSPEVKTQQKQSKLIIDLIQVIKYDGCEYLFYNSGYGVTLEHKGNCKNQAHNPNESTNPSESEWVLAIGCGDTTITLSDTVRYKHYRMIISNNHLTKPEK